MELYFGKLSKSDVEEFGTESTFEHNGEHYWYKLNYDYHDGDIQIVDTCDRMVVLSDEHIQPLMEALGAVFKVYMKANELRQMVEDTRAARVASNTYTTHLGPFRFNVRAA